MYVFNFIENNNIIYPEQYNYEIFAVDNLPERFIATEELLMNQHGTLA